MQTRPCWVEISTSAFEHNYRLLRQTARSHGLGRAASESETAPELLAIVKADAYGHGLEICAKAAEKAGARWLGVTSAEEAVAARRICPDAEILIISGPFRGQGADVLAQRLTCVVWDSWQLQELAAAANDANSQHDSVPVHLELDTGMSRQGVDSEQVDAILAQFSLYPSLRLTGLMTHLYAADEPDSITTETQFKTLGLLVEKIHSAAMRPQWLHVGNSAALLAGSAWNHLLEICRQFQLRPMMRPGLALYGLAPQFSPHEPPAVAEWRKSLQPVLTWKTKVVSVRTIQPGQTIGYNGTFVATEPMRLALLAVGYADGLKRALSNRGAVLVRGKRAPIIGRISMDQTLVDVTDIPGVTPEDEVVLLGRQEDECITADDHAAWAQTVSWEIFTSITARVERRSV